jgi:hypothetical protein
VPESDINVTPTISVIAKTYHAQANHELRTPNTRDFALVHFHSLNISFMSSYRRVWGKEEKQGKKQITKSVR